MLPIPLTPSEVTPAWLTAALRAAGLDGAEVRSVTDSHVQSLTSTMHRLHIEYARVDTTYPATLIWKRSSIDSAVRTAFGGPRGGYEREVRFYHDLAPRIGTRVPHCYLAQYDVATDDHVLLLEDCAPTHRAGELLEMRSVSDTAAALREIALLHCADWDVSPAASDASLDTALANFLDNRESARSFLDETVGIDTVRALDAFADGFVTRGVRLNAGPQTTLHADTHQANMMFPLDPADRVVLVDWQGWRTGAPARDLGRCLVLMLSTEDRRAAERELVAEYCAGLRANGVEYDETQALADYRIGAANQWIWAVNFTRRRAVWDEVTRAAMPSMIRRSAAAALDLLAAP